MKEIHGGTKWILFISGVLSGVFDIDKEEFAIILSADPHLQTFSRSLL